ncbi:hypothetical protein KAW65_07345 [candidate division WOR-3 bacterium]|nr:hypothetical protein [candidate division WOR-3 bacterium]
MEPRITQIEVRRICYLFSVFCSLFICSCAQTRLPPVGRESTEKPIQPLNPQEVKQSIDRLISQNFEFRLEFSKPEVKGTFKGEKVNDRVKIEGCWKFGSRFAEAPARQAEKEKFKAIGIGDREYRWIHGKWKAQERTSETRPISFLSLVLAVEEYKFKNIKNGFLIYEFKPNLLFMSPTAFEAQGELWINQKSELPEKVIVTQPASPSDDKEELFWKFEAKNIGKPIKILNPLAKIQALKITAVQETTMQEFQKIAQILTKRFKLYGFKDVKYKFKKDFVTLYFSSSFLLEDSLYQLVNKLTQIGKIELYKAEYPKQPVYELKEVWFVNNDSTKPILLKEKLSYPDSIGTGKLIDVDFKPGAFGSHTIELTFDKDLPQKTIIVLVVDDKVLKLFPEVWGKTLELTGDKETYLKIKFPLPCKVKTID